jgi:hypothetical protein
MITVYSAPDTIFTQRLTPAGRASDKKGIRLGITMTAEILRDSTSTCESPQRIAGFGIFDLEGNPFSRFSVAPVRRAEHAERAERWVANTTYLYKAIPRKYGCIGDPRYDRYRNKNVEARSPLANLDPEQSSHCVQCTRIPQLAYCSLDTFSVDLILRIF